jgi:hypothetical protein
MALILEAAQSCDFSEALVWIIHRQPLRGTHAMIHSPSRETCRWLPGMPPRHAYDRYRMSSGRQPDARFERLG